MHPLLVAAALLAPPPAAAAPLAPAAEVAQATELLKRGIAFPTVRGRGQVPAYAAYLRDQLVAAGFAPADVVIARVGETATLAARYRGSRKGAKAILVAGHMDVVEADPKDWTRDPFTPVAEGGFLYGRGASDNKFDVSMIVATLIELKREGFRPGRDILLVLSGSEETDWASTETLARRYAPEAELVLNGDGGGGRLSADGTAESYILSAAEKTYADFDVTITDPGGHSSRPGTINAIATLAAITGRIAAYRFPVQSNEITRAAFAAAARSTPGEIGRAMAAFAADPADAAAAERLSREPDLVGQVRTTCVPTMVKGGHAPNALPQKAVLTINCRIFPGTKAKAVEATLLKVAAEPKATIGQTEYPPIDSDPSPLRGDVMAAVRAAVDASHPGLPIVPAQEAGASDSALFRNAGVPSYNVSGLFIRPQDDFIHGLNEKVPLAAIPGALAHWKILLTRLAR